MDISGAQQALDATGASEAHDETGMQRGVGGGASAAIAGGPRHIELEREPGPHVHGQAPASTHGIAHPQVVIEIRKPRERTDLDSARSLGRRGRREQERHRR